MKIYKLVSFLTIIYMFCTSQTCNNNTNNAEYTFDEVFWLVKECDPNDAGASAWNTQCNFPTGNIFMNDLLDHWPWPFVEIHCTDYADDKERLHPYSKFIIKGPDGESVEYGEDFLFLSINDGDFTSPNGTDQKGRTLKALQVKFIEGSTTSIRIEWCTCCKDCDLSLPDGTITNDRGSLFVEAYKMMTYDQYRFDIESGETRLWTDGIQLSCPWSIAPGHPWWDGTCNPG